VLAVTFRAAHAPTGRTQQSDQTTCGGLVWTSVPNCSVRLDRSQHPNSVTLIAALQRSYRNARRRVSPGCSRQEARNGHHYP
jgi:hypothetical protein